MSAYFIALAWVVLTTAVNAQAVSSLSPESDQVKAVRVAHDYGACLALNRRRDIAKLLSLMPGSPEEDKLARQISMSECLGIEGYDLRFDATLLRGSVAEALYKRDFYGTGKGQSRRPVDVYVIPKSLYAEEITHKEALMLTMHQVATCVVEDAPEQVDYIFKTPPVSLGESEAMAAIVPSLKKCVSDKVTLRMGKPELRGYLAEAAYRRAALNGAPS